MAKDKRSIFERLTGVVRIEEGAIEAEITTPQLHKHGQTASNRNQIHNALGQSHEEWAQEENEAQEGQLTVDVYQTPIHIVIQTMIAGVHPEDLDISITRDMVTIKGKRQAPGDVTEEHYYFGELYWGSFSRTIMLPQEIEVEESEAVEKHGLLTIRLPKIDKGRQTKLKVRSAN